MKKFQISNWKLQSGFSLIEIMITVGIMLILLAVTTLNLPNIQRKTTLAATLEVLLADLGQQQIKAMVGDTEGRSGYDTYGIHFTSTAYTLFYDTYSAVNTANFSVTMPTGQQTATTFPNNEVIFAKGTGEIVNYTAAQSTITLSDTTTGEQKVITLNRYGVVTGVN